METLLVALAVLVGVLIIGLVAFTFLSRRGDEADSGGATDTLERPPDVADRVEEPEAAEDVPPGDVAVIEEAPPEPAVPVVEKPTFRSRLGKARSALSGYLGAVLSRSDITDETWDELEEALLRADVGVQTTTDVLDHVRQTVDDQGIDEPDALLDAVKGEMKTRLAGGDLELHLAAEGTSVWLFVGVNGVGKTTTIGKIGKQQIEAGRSVVMAAGDTFRAAAGEQLEMWGDRVGAYVVRGDEGGDPSSIIFDAVQAASARGADVVLADTAGRLHTKTNLMEELSKVRRVANKEPGNVSEVLLVIDATTGQNGLVQAQQFTEAVEVSGVVLTKLDGSAKGGIVLAIQEVLGIPVKLVGLGETADDLIEFDADAFVDALFANGDSSTV